LAEKIDYYGGCISAPFNMDTTNMAMFCLTRHFPQLAPLLAEVITEPAFPEDELQSFIINSKQRLKVDLSKNDVIAYRTLTEYIFGASHPYGYNSFPHSYEALHRDDLIQHYRTNYVAGNCLLFVSGKFEKDTLDILNQTLGQAIPRGHNPPADMRPEDLSPQSLHIYQPDTVQTAIRIGRRMFNRSHPDYFPFSILNTILGGYFGSRLMANIREDKGYTYNIYSSMDPMIFDGFFCIATEVGNDFVERTLDEIYYEMDRLCREPVGEEELAMVRSYLLGNLLGMVDGPFNAAGVIKALVLDELPLDYFPQMAQQVRKISPEELMRIAQKYLSRENMWQIVVGT
jgi:zinc protease